VAHTQHAANTFSYKYLSTAEAMYGTSPRFAEKSLGSYILYHALPVPLDFDSITGMLIPVAKGEMWKDLKNLLGAFCRAVALFSLLEATDYAPFPQKRPAQTLLEFVYWGNLLNNYLVACTSKSPLSHSGLCRITSIFLCLDSTLCAAILDFCFSLLLFQDAASTMLSSGSFLFQIVVSSVSGFRTISFNDRPLTASASPSDFWGR